MWCVEKELTTSNAGNKESSHFDENYDTVIQDQVERKIESKLNFLIDVIGMATHT
jgi:hypothetical protein